MKKLTLREKVLLSMLGVFIVIVFGNMFVLQPLMEKNAELKNDISFAELEESELEMQGSAAAVTEEEYAANLKTKEALIKEFSPYLEPYQIDLMISDLALLHMDEISSFELLDVPALGTEAATTESSPVESTEVTPEEVTEEGESTEISPELGQEESVGVTGASTRVTFTATGNMAQSIDLINEIKDLKYITLETVSITSPTSSGTADNGLTSTGQETTAVVSQSSGSITVTLIIYTEAKK